MRNTLGHHPSRGSKAQREAGFTAMPQLSQRRAKMMHVKEGKFEEIEKRDF
jgi:hypothetical protein